MKSKIIYGILLIIIVLQLTSCQEKKKNHFTIGVSQCSDDLWRETMNTEMKREADFYKNVDVIIKTVKDDTDQQISHIDSLIDIGVDILVISPNESKAFTPVIKKAYDKGIPVILVDRKIETDDYTAYIGANNFEVGQQVGLYVVGILKGKGNIVEMRGWEGSTSDEERHNGFLSVLGNYPNISIVAAPRGDYLKDEAEKQMSELLKENIPIDLVFAFNDPMASGVSNAYKDHKGKKPFIIGIDALTVDGGGVQNIQNGIQDASFIYPTGGDKVVDLAMNILNNNSFERDNILRTTVVDKSNYRVLQLQKELIDEQQVKVDLINSNLDLSLQKYSNQKTLFYLSLTIIVLTLVLLIFLIKAYQTKSLSNRLLEEQNLEIRRQAEILQNQKEQLVSMSKEVEEATHSKLVFFTNISHEFKTPLSLILSPVDTLLSEGNLSPTQKDLLTLVQKNSKRLLFLISEIIEFRSYENGKMKMYFTQSDLKSFIEEISTLFYTLIIQKKISFSFNAGEGLFDIVFDKEKVEKIYYNLLSNAIKHVNFSGVINVELDRVSLDNVDYVKLSVFNSGSYIEADKLKNVFDRFYKIDQNSEGSGIGLALVSTLVEAHKGKIEVFSEEEKGTTFEVLLPTSQDCEQEQHNQNLGYIESRLELVDMVDSDPSPLNSLMTKDEDKPLILIVEDNPDMRKYIKYILSSDYNIIEASNGLDGVDKANKYTPDIIISDVMMEGKDGYELCKTLKSNTATSHIPIILLTACSLDEQKSIGFESGADAYIPKPFNADILKIRIRKLIESRRIMKDSFSNNLMIDTKKESLGELEENFLKELRDYVEKHVSEPELAVEDMAEHLGLSRSQLYRKTKSLTNYSPNDLIRVIRLNLAKAMLMTKTKSISEIAYSTGFSSPSYFAKSFKSVYGISPTEFVEKQDG